MAYTRNNENPANAVPVWNIGGGSLVPPGSTLVEYEQVTDLTGSTALTPPTGATMAVVQVNDGVVRYRPDGVAPTATVGFLAYATGPSMFFNAFDDLHFIQATGSTASLNVLWYASSVG